MPVGLWALQILSNSPKGWISWAKGHGDLIIR